MGRCRVIQCSRVQQLRRTLLPLTLILPLPSSFVPSSFSHLLQSQMRLEQSMQSKIKVYESTRGDKEPSGGKQELPPELQAMVDGGGSSAGGGGGADKRHPPSLSLFFRFSVFSLFFSFFSYHYIYINNKPLAGEKEHLRLRPREVDLQHKVCFFSFFFFLFLFFLLSLFLTSPPFFLLSPSSFCLLTF